MASTRVEASRHLPRTTLIFTVVKGTTTGNKEGIFNRVRCLIIAVMGGFLERKPAPELR